MTGTPLKVSLVLVAIILAACGRAPGPSRMQITGAQLSALQKLVDENGYEITIDNRITILFGLTERNYTLSSYGVAAKDNIRGNFHFFNPLPQDKGYLLTELDQKMEFVYWLDKNFTLQEAAQAERARGQWSLIPVPDARPGMLRELTYWTTYDEKRDCKERLEIGACRD